MSGEGIHPCTSKQIMNHPEDYTPKINYLIPNPKSNTSTTPTKKEKRRLTGKKEEGKGNLCGCIIVGSLPPGDWAEEGAEEAREGEAYARVGPEGDDGGLAESVLNGLDEQIKATDRRHVQGQRHRREGHGEQ